MKRLCIAILTILLVFSLNIKAHAETDVELPYLYHSVKNGHHVYSFVYIGNPDAQVIHFNFNYSGNEAVDFDGYYLSPNNHQFNFEFIQPGIMTITVSNGSFSFVVSYNLYEVSNIYVPMVSN